ncbi:MAG: sulfatase [Alphaproteobacteria bacterium]|nr:sulfatase [Alphaproteobacteria bacterium]MCB9696731.1 sulfatase [Alphaproteobacteria bacterium]
MAAAAVTAGCRCAPRRTGPPNVILVFTDDQGFNDLGCYYTPPPEQQAYARIDTPRLDALAAEGLRLTSFYVAASLCTPSRAALLTGCYPPRVGFGDKERGLGVLSPSSREGLSPTETTIARMLKARGYRTACVGKWHLGHLPAFRPTRHGFDEFFGVPWSNNQPPLNLVRGEHAERRLRLDEPLTAEFTREAMDFVRRSADAPFFLYLAYTAPHEPWAVLPAFRGTSARGEYGDEIVEIDHHVGLLVDEVERLGLTRDTIVIFASDNGPWLDAPVPGGSAWPFRGGKSESWEGGFRSPCIWRWPGTLPAGRVSDELVTALDVLPTLARVTGASLPTLPIDGLDAWSTLLGDAPSPRDTFFYYARGRLEAVRHGRYKRMFPNEVRRVHLTGGVFDLAADPGESTDVAAAHPEETAELERLAEEMRARLGDALTGRVGAEIRPIGS